MALSMTANTINKGTGNVENHTVFQMDPLELGFLVCGRTGVGKSSLVNSLLGDEVCKVVDPGLIGGNLKPCTAELEQHVLDINGLTVQIFDSPGLQGDATKEQEQLQNIYVKCQHVDLVLYCVDMTIPRYAVSEIRSTDLLTQKFGPNFWKRCVFVLTKANCVKLHPRESCPPVVYHKRLYSNLLQSFRDHLILQGVPRDIVFGIPAVAAGYYDPMLNGTIHQNDRFIWYVSDKVQTSDKPVDFLAELWLTCLETAAKNSRNSGTVFINAIGRDRVKPQQGGTAAANRLNNLLQKEIQLLEKLRGEYVVKMVAEGNQRLPKAAIVGRSPDLFLTDMQISRLQTVVKQKGIHCQLFGTAVGAAIGGVLGMVYGPSGLLIGTILGGSIGFAIIWVF